ncbi:MAG: long-chain fatty acid--CoA ligase [Betaproteobacteria bacterium]|nr:long-chain fatty acid--CoA ligase [Betaproteobacteria bacterium]
MTAPDSRFPEGAFPVRDPGWLATHAIHTWPQMLRRRAAQWGGRPALRHKLRGLWHTWTWAMYWEQVRATAHALAARGLRRGAVVSVLAENRPEWLFVDLGAQALGVITNGIYPTSSPEQIAYFLNDSGTELLVVENQEQFDKAWSIRNQCPALRTLVVIDLRGLRALDLEGVIGWETFLGEGRQKIDADASAFEREVEAGSEDDIAFLVYTSGTTGPPKGAMISQRNLMFQLEAAPQYLEVGPGDRGLSFLPLCHIAERLNTVGNPLAMGHVMHFPEHAGTVFNDLREVSPHLVFGPPRFWEKMHSQVRLALDDAPGWIRSLADRGVAASLRRVDARLREQPLSAWSRGGEAVRAALLWPNLLSFMGLKDLRTAITGAAPVPPDLLRWYMAIGVVLREAYGLTETCGFCTANPRGAVRLGYAGLRARGTEVKIGANDEVLVRGPNVFAGYWGRAEQTREAIDAEGWLHTGDCGEMDADGYLRIRDRIKDILITSGGKNINPSEIENRLKFNPYIADAVVIGEARPYLTCLVMIDADNVARYAQDRQIPFTDFASLTRTAEVVELVARQIEEVNTGLARVETIKQFRILSQLLSPEDEELTPTMKLKRKVLARKYADLIEAMYSG